MAAFYRQLAEQNHASFHLVSSSPNQLYPELQTFLDDNNFPSAEFHLKSFRLNDSSILNIFDEPTGAKTKAIESILERYPKRTFILIGDSGEADPEIYAQIARNHTDQIAAIYIRNVTQQPRTDARYQATFEGLPDDLWQVFTDPDELPLPSPEN